MYGNRGGRFHDPASKTLGKRTHASRQWICCVLAFEGRRKEVWGPRFTDLFFLDEVTALAAGHRPCFECRRTDAKAFAAAWARAKGLSQPPRAPEMDAALHDERMNGRSRRMGRAGWMGLPDGAMVATDDGPCLVWADLLLPWSFSGYGAPLGYPPLDVVCLTPPSTVDVLRAGYVPRRAGVFTPSTSPRPHDLPRDDDPLDF